ncbi:MAG: Clp protease N-terminal domain-containing protein [Pirellulaceae bacterium]
MSDSRIRLAASLNSLKAPPIALMYKNFGADYVLLGIAHYDDPCIASELLRLRNVSLDDFMGQHGRRLPLILDATSRLSDAFIETAWTEARELNHDYVGTEHLLLAIIRSESHASAYLRATGMNHQMLRSATVALLGPGTYKEQPSKARTTADWTLTFQDDGTFEAKSTGEIVKGTYKLEGRNLSTTATERNGKPTQGMEAEPATANLSEDGKSISLGDHEYIKQE